MSFSLFDPANNPSAGGFGFGNYTGPEAGNLTFGSGGSSYDPFSGGFALDGSFSSKPVPQAVTFGGIPGGTGLDAFGGFLGNLFSTSTLRDGGLVSPPGAIQPTWLDDSGMWRDPSNVPAGSGPPVGPTSSPAVVAGDGGGGWLEALRGIGEQVLNGIGAGGDTVEVVPVVDRNAVNGGGMSGTMLLVLGAAAAAAYLMLKK